MADDTTKGDLLNYLQEMKQDLLQQIATLGHRITGLDEKVTDQFTAFDEKFTGRLHSLDEKVTDQFTTFDEKFTDQLHALDEKFTGQFRGLDEKFTGWFHIFEGRFGTLEGRFSTFESRLNTLELQMRRGFEGVNVHLTALQEDLEATMKVQYKHGKKLARL